MGSIKVGSLTPSLVAQGGSLVNSMFFQSDLIYSNFFSASGGTMGTYTSGSDTYIYHEYNSTANLNVHSGYNNLVQVMLVGGGGGSPTDTNNSFNAVGGAGGGGVLYTSSVLLQSGSYTITVGAGGIGWNSGVGPGDGQPSSIVGPGLGLFASGGLTYRNSSFIGAANGAPTSFAGGNSYDVGGAKFCGGGGGAGEVGYNGVFGAAGNGGNGKVLALNGTSSYYGGGGGGGSYDYSGKGLGGLGGGGNGGERGLGPVAGVANTGGGAGGVGYFANSSAKAGGSGKVIITYKSGSLAPPTPPPPPFPPEKIILPITESAGTLVIWSDTTSLTGSVLYDKSGKGNNALVSGSTLALTGSNGFMFNGTNNYLNWATTLTGQPSSSYTLQYYGVPFSSSVNYDFFVKDFYTNGWDTIYEPGPTKITFRDNAGADKTSSLFTPSTTDKQQIVLTVNADTNVIQFYRNGAFVGNFNRTTDVVNNFNADASPFKFGFNTNADATYFKGSLASVALYNRVITAADVFFNWGALTGSSF
jgi:hypothetical protein